MKKHILAASIASMLSGAAFAAVNMDTGVGSGGIYANEIVISTATNLPTAGTVDHEATVAFGASFATDFVAYVRFDLPAGVTFTANPGYSVNDSAPAAALVSVAQGGAGQSYVIFAVAPSNGGENLVGNATGTFTAAGITIPSKQSVSLRYRLYETLTNAANETLDLKSVTASSFLTFSDTIAITQGASVTRTADVAATGGAYRQFVGASTEESLNSFTVTFTPRALISGAAAAVGDVLADTNSVAITGSFVARGAVTLDTSAACNGLSVPSTTATDTGATFAPLTATEITAATWYVCYAVNGTAQIATSSYTGSIDLVGETGFAPVDGSTGNAEVVRNGTVLKAAFAEGLSGGSISVYLANTSTIPAPFTTRCLRGGAAVTGAASTVPANSTGRFGLTSGLGCPADTRSVELTFAVPTGTVNGSVLRQNATTGVGGFDGMVGNE